MPLQPGDKAPDFTLLDQNGESFTLSKSLKQRKARHLVFFYPKADTPGCTQQACGLRDVAQDGTVIIGISPDTVAKQGKFDAKFSFGYPLLADEDHAVAEAYDVWAEKSMYGRKYMGIVRSAFVIEPNGKIAEASYKISPKDTATLYTKSLAAD
jgi:peroxiredoxin Q/BCP